MEEEDEAVEEQEAAEETAEEGAAPEPKYSCCGEEHTRGAWECTSCRRRFHSGCPAGAKKGERARAECIACVAAAADAVASGSGRAIHVNLLCSTAFV